MSDKTAIEWTDATWNPLVGCSRVSQGCVNCYAERIAHRFSGVAGSIYEGTTRLVNGRPTWNGTVRLNATALTQPLRWKRPRRIFVNSMSDLFHESVPDDWIDRVFAIMALSPQHTFQVLTKRPERMLAYMTHDGGLGRWGFIDGRAREYAPIPAGKMLLGPLPNVWLGVSVEDQATADERIPLLLRTPAALRFLSCEPLLGPVDLECTAGEITDYGNGISAIDALRGDHVGIKKISREVVFRRDGVFGRGIDWVIVGGESGPGARPMHPDWIRALRNQCAAAGVPYFFKQWGEWEVASRANGHYGCAMPEDSNRATWLDSNGRLQAPSSNGLTNAYAMVRVGKRAAGRLLDGAEHNAFPTPPQTVAG